MPFYRSASRVFADAEKHSPGWGGIQKRPNEEIVILVSSLRRVAADANLRWLFTDSHAYYQWANYYDDLEAPDKIDWPPAGPGLQARPG